MNTVRSEGLATFVFAAWPAAVDHVLLEASSVCHGTCDVRHVLDCTIRSPENLMVPSGND